MLLARAPPAKMTLTPAAEESPPEIWKIHAECHGLLRAIVRRVRRKIHTVGRSAGYGHRGWDRDGVGPLVQTRLESQSTDAACERRFKPKIYKQDEINMSHDRWAGWMIGDVRTTTEIEEVWVNTSCSVDEGSLHVRNCSSQLAWRR